MIRVTHENTTYGERGLRLEGRLGAPDLDTLRRAIDAGPSGAGLLDLSGLTHLDHAAGLYLVSLRRRGWRFSGGSLYIEHLLKEDRAMSIATQTRAPATAAEAPDEAALLARLRAGEEEAYEELVRLAGGRMLAVARRMMACDEDAQDAVQDAFVSAIKSLDRFDGRSRLTTWLHRIVVNACLMKRRAASRRRERPIEALLPRFLEDGHQESPAAAWNAEPSGGIERAETRTLVRRCIDELPEAYREVIMVRDIEGLDTMEAATMLGITENAVKTRLHRARQALRELLDPHMREGANER